MLGRTFLTFWLACGLAAPAAWAHGPDRVRATPIRVRGDVPRSGWVRPKPDLEIAMRDLARIRFDEGSYRLHPRMQRPLHHAANILDRHPDVVVYIVGHTDERGSLRDNRALALRRAHAVAAHLARFGVSERRIVVVPFGEAGPLVRRHDARAWAANRRVELCLVEHDRRLVPPRRRPL